MTIELGHAAIDISEKEFAVIREIGSSVYPDQRTIAHRTGISLGLTNLIIKRLITKGYVMAKQLNQKKIEYMLTPQGFSEKAKKSYAFTLKTIGHVKTIKEAIQDLIIKQSNLGYNRFIIRGTSELADIAEMAFSSGRGNDLRFTRDLRHNGLRESSAVLIAVQKKNGRHSEASFELISYLAESGIFYW